MSSPAPAPPASPAACVRAPLLAVARVHGHEADVVAVVEAEDAVGRVFERGHGGPQRVLGAVPTLGPAAVRAAGAVSQVQLAEGQRGVGGRRGLGHGDQLQELRAADGAHVTDVHLAQCADAPPVHQQGLQGLEAREQAHGRLQGGLLDGPPAGERQRAEARRVPAQRLQHRGQPLRAEGGGYLEVEVAQRRLHRLQHGAEARASRVANHRQLLQGNPRQLGLGK